MIPRFDKGVSRSQLESIELSRVSIKPEGYDPERIRNGYSHLSHSKSPRNYMNFESQLGRVQPKNPEEETPSLEYVSFADFLPNRIKNSPIKRDHSMTQQTMKYYPRLLKRGQGSTTTMQRDEAPLNAAELNKILFTRGGSTLML